MGSIVFKAGQKADLEDLRKSTVVSVDLGFSVKSKSTGVAWRTAKGKQPAPSKLTFEKAIKRVAQLFDSEAAAVLILEAPLSAQFNADGNPAARLPFEQIYDVQKKKNVNRFWYIGPGASTLIAAMFFLRRLTSMLASNDGNQRVFLYEGLHTFKDGPTDHAQDAVELLEAFLNRNVVDVNREAATEWLSVLQLIGGESDSAIPAIVTVRQEQSACNLENQDQPNS